MTKKIDTKLSKKWKSSSDKLNIVGEIQHLTKQYFLLVNSIGNMFLTKEEKKQIQEEINEIETTLKSKLTISSFMRGY